MRPASLVPLCFLTWLLTACTHAPLGAGEERWLLLESQHFSLYTDLKRERALEELRSMERQVAGFEQSGWERVEGSELRLRLNVVMFARAYDLERYVQHGIVGYHVPDVLYEPWVVVPGPGSQEDRLQTVAHELTHYMADAAMPRQPRWFAEGLATYFETGRFGDDGRFVLGSVPEQRFKEILALGLLRPSVLLRGEVTRDDDRFYSSSWLLVHYLMNEQGYAFQEYQKGLLRGLTYERAWQEAFPALSPEGLDKNVEEYVRRGTYARFHVPIEEPTYTEPRVRVLSRADEHALQAILWVANVRENPQDEARAREAAAQALAVDPDHLLAGALKVSFAQDEDPARALSEAKRLFERHPQEWLASALLGEAAWKVGEVLPLGSIHDVTRTAALAPWQPRSWLVLAEQEALRGERAKAVLSSKRAQDMQPSKLGILRSRVEILMRLGECGLLGPLVSSIESHDPSDDDRKALASIRPRADSPLRRSAQATCLTSFGATGRELAPRAPGSLICDPDRPTLLGGGAFHRRIAPRQARREPWIAALLPRVLPRSAGRARPGSGPCAQAQSWPRRARHLRCRLAAPRDGWPRPFASAPPRKPGARPPKSDSAVQCHSIAS